MEKEGLQHEVHIQQRSKQLSRRAVIAHALIVSAYTFIFLLVAVTYGSTAKEQQCVEQLSTWSPATSAVKYETTVFEVAFNASNPYRGPPSPELDAAWDALSRQPAIAISKDELVNKLGKDPLYAVHAPEGDEEVYRGFIEVFHQMHCVDMLRRYTHWDYYAEKYPAFHDNADTLRIHLDHCIDVLRINLMCNSDVSVMTFHWIAEKSWPDPDFETRHKCRNFDAIVDWINDTPRKREQIMSEPADAVLFQPLLRNED